MGAAEAIGAVDIGGTKIGVGVVDMQGRLLAHAAAPTAARDGFAAAMQRTCAMLRDVCGTANVSLGGIGIGCTGPVDPLGGTIGDVAFLEGWEGCNPVAHLGAAFGCSVAMENDADAAVLAEARWGAGRNKHSTVCVMVGTGIGVGIVLNGSLYRGVGGSHPEIGHHVIDRTGPPCFCGANGCWEVLARGPAMVERMRHLAPQAGANHAALSAREICDLARAGDVAAKDEIEREASYLGIGVANLVTIFAPEVIALGGSVMRSADLFMPTIQMIVGRNCGLVDWQKTTVTTTALDADGPLIGAAAVWRRRYAGVPIA